MTVKPYCVMARFPTVEGVAKFCTVFVEAGSKEEATRLGIRRMAAQVSPEVTWDGDVTVYEEERFETLRQLKILPPSPKEKTGPR